MNVFNYDATTEGPKSEFSMLVHERVRRTGESYADALEWASKKSPGLADLHDAWSWALQSGNKNYLPAELHFRFEQVYNTIGTETEDFVTSAGDVSSPPAHPRQNPESVALTAFDQLVDQVFRQLQAVADSPQQVYRPDVENLIRSRYPDLVSKMERVPAEPKPKVVTF